MAFCNNCGEALRMDHNYCPGCGRHLNQSANNNPRGSICAYCQGPVVKSDRVIVCPRCGVAHHRECWQENGGCAVFGCGENTGANDVEAVGRGSGKGPFAQNYLPARRYTFIIGLLLVICIGLLALFTLEYNKDLEYSDGTHLAFENNNIIDHNMYKDITVEFRKKLLQVQDAYAAIEEQPARSTETSDSPSYQVLRYSHCIEGCCSDGDMDISCHDCRCPVAVFREPRLESSVAWYGTPGESVYLVSKHNGQYICPDHGAYIYWEVENPATGERGWLNSDWQGSVNCSGTHFGTCGHPDCNQGRL